MAAVAEWVRALVDGTKCCVQTWVRILLLTFTFFCLKNISFKLVNSTILSAVIITSNGTRFLVPVPVL